MSESDKIAEQRRQYGAPVGELVGRVSATLGLSQSAVAGVLGLSPPMVSQLVRGNRVKIGNPIAVSRLRALLTLADQAPGLSRDAVAQRLAEIRQSRPTLTSREPALGASEAAALVRGLLTAVASGRELDHAAEVLDDIAPGLAEVVRAYGTGTPSEAERHWTTVSHLMRPRSAGSDGAAAR